MTGPEQHQIRVVVRRGRAEITVIGKPLRVGTYRGAVIRTGDAPPGGEDDGERGPGADADQGSGGDLGGTAGLRLGAHPGDHRSGADPGAGSRAAGGGS